MTLIRSAIELRSNNLFEQTLNHKVFDLCSLGFEQKNAKQFIEILRNLFFDFIDQTLIEFYSVVISICKVHIR